MKTNKLMDEIRKSTPADKTNKSTYALLLPTESLNYYRNEI